LDVVVFKITQIKNMTNNLQINNLYFIDCIDSNESQNTNAYALYFDTVSKMKIINKEIDTDYFKIETKLDFLKRFDSINEKNIENQNVLIHIYLHGSKNLDGLVANDKTLISWEEIQSKTRRINIKTNNGLFLVLALCHGEYFAEKINIRLKSPFNSIIASRYEEYVPEIYNLFQKFYNNLVYDNNIIRAYLEAKTETDNFFYKNTSTVIVNAIKSMSQKLDESLNQLYSDFIHNESMKMLSFEEFRYLKKRALQEIINKMENEFFIR
jgi:hypothetical protein